MNGRSGPLQSMRQREVGLRDHPLTIYPHPLTTVSAWVRFGPEAVRVDAKLARSTPLAAGIEFRSGDRTFRCCVEDSARRDSAWTRRRSEPVSSAG